MRNSKRCLFVVVVLGLILSVTAASAAGKTIFIGMDQEPESLDATTIGLHLVRWVSDPIYGRLVWLDETGTKIVPAIAKSWTYLNDKKLEFKLRNDVIFHNGRALVANDIVHCLKIQSDKAYGGTQYNSFAPYVDSIEAPDAQTVVVNLKAPYPAILSIIVQIPIFAPETASALSKAPVGCGPFKFVSWQKNQMLRLEAFDKYYEKGVPAYQYLVYKFYAAYNTCLTAFMSGEVDLINWMSPIDVPTIERLGNSYTQSSPAGIYYFQGSMTRAPFNKPGVMRALALAVDRNELNELVLDKKGLSVWLPLNPKDYYYPADIEYKPDLAAAKSLLAKAGLPNGFTCSLLAPLTAVEGKMAEVLQAQFARVGVTIKLNVLEVPAFLEKWRSGDFDLAICGHGFEIDPSIQLNRWMTKDTRNYGKYSNPEFDRLCAEAVVTVDPAKRKELYYKAYHLFVDDAAVNYCIGENRYSAVRNTVQGLIKRFAINDYTRLTIK